MEQVISERTKWVSRTLAVISAILGLLISIELIRCFFSPEVTISSGVVLITLVLMAALCLFLFWLAVQLWTKVEPKHVRWCAAISALTLSGGVLEFIHRGIKSILDIHWPQVESTGIETQVPTFIALCLAGICYLAVKRVLFFLLKVKEDIDAVKFRQSRTRYFFILSVIFWSMLMGAAICIGDKYGKLQDTLFVWFLFAELIVPLLMAVFFYRICIRLFVTKPLKTLHQSPQGLNNDSPG